ncbi:hypothetical protein LG299_12655 [Microbacterium lacus]|uniref:hypothetical protein n=1 Tax=Microbacterium lacus TaxID=415217 RepID=UPI0038501663
MTFVETGTRIDGALSVTVEQRIALAMVAERRVRFWLSVPFNLRSGYFIDDVPATTDEHRVYEQLRSAGLIRIELKVLPFNYLVLTSAGTDALRW